MQAFSSSTLVETSPLLERWSDKFDHHARQHPDKIAIISGNRSLSYAALATTSNRIANLLRANGIGRGTFVGLGLHRCLELPSALLGILKSGAAYLPLDPGYPTARIEQMISSSKICHVVTKRDLVNRFSNIQAICIDGENIETSSADDPSITIEPDDFIYAIFTSGSTGHPKAASVFHRGFENLLSWYSSELTLGLADRTLVISSPSFDLTQKNFFAPLITGGTLILDDGQTYDISRISKLIRDHGVTILNCTPSAFYPLVDAAATDQFQALASIRFAVLGGEAISVPRLRAWLEHPNCHAEVINSYGPTECTDICAFYRLHKDNLDDFPFVPLGSEIPNVQVSIRDEALNPLPDGKIGELCISGAGVGGGYLNDPSRTTEVFIDSLYRTGDLAKRLPSNILEFRGRADYQVKVNGFRIELGEIEIALNAHPNVCEAIVIATENRLIAHVQGTASVPELREFLATRLPTYMAPGEFRFVENFPYTPNGKIDRLALSKEAASTPNTLNTGPLLERKILALWSEILNRPVSDATVNFFDLGGNSIHVAIMHVRLMEMTGRKFAITELFALPTARSVGDFLSPKAENLNKLGAQDRARLAHAGFSKFRRPTNR